MFETCHVSVSRKTCAGVFARTAWKFPTLLDGEELRLVLLLTGAAFVSAHTLHKGSV